MIKIEFSGSGEEVRNEMLRLLGMQEAGVQVKSPAESQETPEGASVKTRRGRAGRKPAGQATWTEEESQRLLNEIKPNARKILIELSSKPDGYRRRDLVEAIGLREQAVRGQLSSVGSALRRMDKPSPISKKRVEGALVYRLNPVFAAVARQQAATE